MCRWWTRAAVALTAASAVVLGAVPAAQADGESVKLLGTRKPDRHGHGAHIHAGARGVAGGIVVGLQVPNRLAADCITAVPDDQDSTETLTQSELAAIVANPADFYVNVRNAVPGRLQVYANASTHGRWSVAGPSATDR